MKLPLALLTILSLALTMPARADEVADYFSTLQTLFAKYFPKVTATAKNGGLTLDCQTRIFLIHERPRGGGDWQDASPQRGPNPGGIYCEIVSEEGPYNDQAEAPQIFDKRYFKILLVAPYSKRLNRHLHILLYYPDGTPETFLREFKEAVDRFEKL
jgi:hypothetical protein